jgi:hypothetical protein
LKEEVSEAGIEFLREGSSPEGPRQNVPPLGGIGWLGEPVEAIAQAGE